MEEVKVLLGVTTGGELAFGRFRIENEGIVGRAPYFAASFDTVKPFKTEDIGEDYCRDWLEGLDKETLYNLCESLDCSPSDLPYEFYSKHEIDDYIDCSLYPERITLNGIEFMFESDGCGQHDLLVDSKMAEYTSEAGFRELYSLWKGYHLMHLNAPDIFKLVCDHISNIVKIFNEVDEKTWIENYLRKTFILPMLHKDEEDDAE